VALLSEVNHILWALPKSPRQSPSTALSRIPFLLAA
jgi:hypothetical protein